MQTAYIETDDGQTVACQVSDGLAIHDGDLCVFESHRIMDTGQVVRLTQEGKGQTPDPADGKVIRCATLRDQAKAKENAVMSRMARKSCVAAAGKLGQKFRFVRVRYSFDRATLMVTLVAEEERPDIKPLSTALSSELNTRVDVRQIGVRDEAAALGGLGPCGRELCCCTWLQRFESVNVRMAKTQGLSLNSGVISGMCGRLRCCLRYENEQYRQMDRTMPRGGARVECPAGEGRICGKNMLTRKVKVRLESDRVVECDADEVKKTQGVRRKKKGSVKKQTR